MISTLLFSMFSISDLDALTAIARQEVNKIAVHFFY